MQSQELTPFHLLSSSCASLWNSSGVLVVTAVPCAASAPLILFSFAVLVSAAYSLSSIGFGVPLGASNPCHPL